MDARENGSKHINMDTKPRDSAYCKWESAFSLLHLSIYGFFWYRVSKNIGKWAKRARTPQYQTCSTRKYVAPLDFKFFRDFSEFFIFHGVTLYFLYNSSHYRLVLGYTMFFQSPEIITMSAKFRTCAPSIFSSNIWLLLLDIKSVATMKNRAKRIDFPY